MLNNTTNLFFNQLFSTINVKIIKGSLKSQLEKYHYLPTIIDTSNILNNWNVKNITVNNIPLENLKDAPLPIISITN